MISPNPNWPLLAAAWLPWGSLAVAALITPRLTRPDLFFSVTVNPGFRQTPPARDILRRYDWAVGLAAALSLVLTGLVQVGSCPWMLAGLFSPVALELAVWFIAFQAARLRALPHHVEPSSEREAALAPRQDSLPGGWLAQAGPFALLAAVLACLWARWDRIPARVPIHWGANGLPDGWSGKNWASVCGTALIGLLACGLLASLWIAISRGTRRIHGGGVRAQREARFLRSMSFFMLGMEYWLALIMAFFSLAALRANPEAPLRALWPMMAGQTLLVATVFFIAWRFGQGGWRAGAPGIMGEKSEDQTQPVGDRTPDACWKLGIFYCNGDDPALFVEKRFGVGWTLNFANPRCWLVVGGILLFIVAILAISILAAAKPKA